MKISITVSDATVLEAAAVVNVLSGGAVELTVPDDFVHGAEAKPTPPPQTTAPVKFDTAKAEPAPEPTAASAKPKRKRRTKAQMASARTAEEEEKAIAGARAAGETVPDEPATNRRRRASPDAEPISRRRRKPETADPTPALTEEQQQAFSPTPETEPNAEITDEDVAKAASIAATRVTADVVMAVLEEFGVANVAMLDQDARRDFMSILDQKVDAALDG